MQALFFVYTLHNKNYYLIFIACLFYVCIMNIKKLLLIILSIVFGATFIYSAYTKIYPIILPFEYTIVEFVKLPWLLAAITARLIIGVEAALGTLIIVHLFGYKKLVLKLSLLMLVVFSIYLVYLWATVGNDVNCGCFGDDVFMSPVQSLIKNIILIVLNIILLKHHKGFGKRIKTTTVSDQVDVAKTTYIHKESYALNIIALILFLVITTVPFIYAAIPGNQPTWMQEDQFKIKLSALYEEGKEDAPKEDLYTGKHIISFLSLSCPHCRIAAQKMHIMHERNPDLPFYFVVAGKDEYLEDFWEDTKAIDIPHTRLQADSFTAIAGYSWPKIYYVEDSTVVAQTDYLRLNQKELEDWLKK